MPPFDFRPWLSVPGEPAAPLMENDKTLDASTIISSPQKAPEVELNFRPSRFSPADRWAIWLALLAFSGGLFASLHFNGAANPQWRALLYPRPTKTGSPATRKSSYPDDISTRGISGIESSRPLQVKRETADASSGSQTVTESNRERVPIPAPNISALPALTNHTAPPSAGSTLAALANPPPYENPPLVRAISTPRVAMPALHSASKKKAVRRTAKTGRKTAVNARSILAKWWASITQKLFGRRPSNGAKGVARRTVAGDSKAQSKARGSNLRKSDSSRVPSS